MNCGKAENGKWVGGTTNMHPSNGYFLDLEQKRSYTEKKYC